VLPRGLFRIYGLVLGNLLLLMGGQLAYLWLVPPQQDGTPLLLPQVPLLPYFTLILLCSGALIVGALLQHTPRPLLFLPSRRRGKLPLFRGYFTPGLSERYYHRPQPENDLPLPQLPQLPPPAMLRQLPVRQLELPAAKWLLLGFLMAIALGVAVLAERGNWLWLFPLAFIAAFSFPALLWVSYIYRRTRGEPEPQRMVLIALSWGMFATLPASLLNDAGGRLLAADPMLMLEGGAFGRPEILLVAAIAPLVEEALKPLGLLFVLDRLKTPYEGVLYGVACGMGFAMMENMLYDLLVLIWYGADAWTINAFARGVGSTVLHAVGPALVGFALALSQHSSWSAERIVPATYLGGVIIHGAWNGAATLPFIYPGDTQMATVSWAALGLVLVTCLALVRELLRRGVTYDAPSSASAEVKDEPQEEGNDEENSEGGDDDPPDEAWAPPEP
tara:strand:+ start:132 stop:1469 length:1338 start_codon:yes stop_codon:yes gene_type:complete